MRAPREPARLCLRYDFAGVSGYAVLRRELPLEFPRNYALVLAPARQRAAERAAVQAGRRERRQRVVAEPAGLRAAAQEHDLTIRKRQIEFAWGPTSDRTLRRAAAIELVVASGEGGRGELCFERLALRTLPRPDRCRRSSPARPPRADAARARRQGDTAWRSARGAAQPWQVDFGAPRELNGLLLRWPDGARASDFDVQFSDDGNAGAPCAACATARATCCRCGCPRARRGMCAWRCSAGRRRATRWPRCGLIGPERVADAERRAARAGARGAARSLSARLRRRAELLDAGRRRSRRRAMRR